LVCRRREEGKEEGGRRKAEGRGKREGGSEGGRMESGRGN
jgi:hypothetical protein